MSVLLDTGVLLRAFVPADPNCEPVRECLRLLRRHNEELVVAQQILAEFYNVSTRPSSARGGYGLAGSTVDARLRFIERLCRRLLENDESYELWKKLISKYQVRGVAVHDARLAAIMLAHGIDRVLTINEQDFHRYAVEGITVWNPVSLLDSRT
jgi:predicted nucleic acid-binding protein